MEACYQVQYGDGGFLSKSRGARKGRLGRVLVRSDVEVKSRSDFKVLRGSHLLIDIPIKISPKMVFVCKTDSLGRDNLNRPIWPI